MGIIGGTLTGPLIFILPPLFYAKITKMEKLHDENQIRWLAELDVVSDDDSCDNDLENSTGYGTFNRMASTKDVEKRPGLSKCVKRMYSDCVLSSAVILFGICATIASTYFSVVDVININNFWSPCITNISYSFVGL